MKIFFDETGIQKPLTKEELGNMPSNSKVYAPWSTGDKYWEWEVRNAYQNADSLYFYRTKEEAIEAGKYCFNLVHEE